MDCIYARTVDCIFSPTTNNTSTTLSTLTPPITPIKPIAPALFSPISSISSAAVQDVNSSDRSPSNASSPPNVISEEKKKSVGGRKRKAESLEEKEQRQRERILRNRHAAQMSRDKKRRQMADLESQNNILKEENVHLSKRVKAVEEENTVLSAKLDALSAQLSEIQSQLTFPSVTEMTKVLLDGVRGSAVSATSENDSLMMTDLKEDIEITCENCENRENFNNNDDDNNEIQKPSSITFARETPEKSQQRPIKTRNLYGTSLILTFPIWICPPQMLKQLLLTFSIVFWTTTGQQKSFLLFSNNRMVCVDGVVISELIRHFEEKRWLRSVKAVCGCGSSDLKNGPREWRKYPP